MLVRTENVSRFYDSGSKVTAVDQVNLCVEEGDFVAILGPSGSGKSTLLNLIGTIDFPSVGRVLVNGTDTHSLAGNDLADFRRANIGFVFQLYNLISVFNALENVMIPLIPYKNGLAFNLEERAKTLLQAVGLSERARHFPGQLSGGESQRVAIARALINYPKLLLADEPTGNLDRKTGREIISLLARLNATRGITIIMVTHDREVASVAQRRYNLVDGRIEEMNE